MGRSAPPDFLQARSFLIYVCQEIIIWQNGRLCNMIRRYMMNLASQSVPARREGFVEQIMLRPIADQFPHSKLVAARPT